HGSALSREMPKRSRVLRKPLHALRFFHALRRQPVKEFRDSSLLTLEINNGIQLGPINVVEREIYTLGFARFVCFELKTEHWSGGRISDRIIGNAEQACIYLAVIDSLAQPDFDAFVGKPNEVGMPF